MINPILELREDILNFLDATVTDSDNEMARVGYRFARLVKEYAEEYYLDEMKHFCEACLSISEKSE